MATLNFSASSQNSLADSLAALHNGGQLKIYTGAMPANANSAPTGTLLCTITLPNPAFGAASGGSASKTGTWSASAVASGVAGYGRFLKSDGTTVIADQDISATGGGGNLQLDNTTINNGQTVTVTSYTVSQPA